MIEKDSFWEDLCLHEKKSRLYLFLTSRKSAVWHVFDKDKQTEWKKLWKDGKGKDDAYYDKIRDDMLKEYIDALPKKVCKRKITKLYTTLFLIGRKSEWEKARRKEYNL